LAKRRINSLNDIIELKLTPEKMMFPKREADNKNDFRIYSCNTRSTEVKLNPYNNLSIKGIMQRLDLGVEYDAQIQLDKIDPQYGASYNVLSIYQDIPETLEGQSAFLATLMTELQLKEVYKTYPEDNILQLIIDDKFDYKKVINFGPVVYGKIRERVMENLVYKEILSKLGKYGITYDVILKLELVFGSKELAIQKIEDNPYELTRLQGFGFKRADKIAKLMGFSHDNPQRIKYGIRFTLDENQQGGHTFMYREDLLRSASEKLEIEIEMIDNLLDQTDELKFIGDKISLLKTYNAEYYIAKRFKEMLNRDDELEFNAEEFIEYIEKEYNTKLTNQQRDFFHAIKKNNLNLLVGYAGCVDMDTEFFDGYRWKNISDYTEGDLVLQYNESGEAELVKPLRYIKLPEKKMTLIKTSRGSINQCLSDEHTIVYKTSKGHLAKIPFYEMKKRHENNECGFNGRFLTTFKYSGNGINLSESEIRLMVAVIADGSYIYNVKGNKCRVNIKKERKKERLTKILEDCEIIYKRIDKDSGYSSFYFHAPIKTKKFDSFWYQCNTQQLRYITEEVLHWDGSIRSGRTSFSTAEKESADFIQFAFASIGKRSTIQVDNRIGQLYKSSKNKLEYIRKSLIYTVTISSGNSEVSLISRQRSTKTMFEDYRTIDGYKYCFTLASGMWVMRRNGRIAITGNCGKSFLQKFLVDLLNKLKLTYVLLSPSAKAAKVTKKYTNADAQTIHRRIGYGMDKSEEQMYEIYEDFVVIDESGMTDVFILSSLLAKIRNPKTRLLFVGDDFQLLSIQAGNFLHDVIESGVIPMTKLDIVFRQGEGGILDIATKIRQGESFVDKDFDGKRLFGNNLLLHCVEQIHMESGYRSYYKVLLNSFKPEDIMVLSPTKKGKLGTIEINKYIQSLVNPPDENKIQYEYGYDNVIRVGDYILNTVNMYRIASMLEEAVDVINGDSGKVIDIKIEDDRKPEKDDDLTEKEKKGIIIKIDDEMIRLDLSLATQLLSAWSLTIHKSQGSSAEATLIVVDRSNKFQISANLIYTAVTRSVHKCILLTQAETLNYAIRKVDSMRRNTHLCDLLKINYE
jgi:ATP-dependent exoDNAse (exonuclease V) alpha subunit